MNAIKCLKCIYIETYTFKTNEDKQKELAEFVLLDRHEKVNR
jgi:hypothetical protein